MGTPPLRVAFGDFELDEARNELRRGGARVDLQPKPLQLLFYLVRHRDRVVPARELHDEVWPDVIVAPTALSSALREIRQALGDTGATQRMIRTLRGHGYQFIADVEVLSLEPEAPAPEPEWRPVWHAVLAVGAVLLLGVVAVTGWRLLPGPSPPPIRSLAVLPLQNLSGDPAQEHVADGMTEALIGELAKLGSLRVTSRTSVMQYKDKRATIPEIAKELGIAGVIQGSVIREADRIRVTAQLIDARSDTHLWAESFERELGGVLALLSDVSQAIAEEVQLELTPEERASLTAPRTVKPEAYDAYLRGLQLIGGWHLASLWAPPAMEQFERAVQLDPGFAEAWTGLAGARVALAITLAPRSEFTKARDAAERALELDDRLGEAHAILGQVRLWHDWDFAGARRAYERALELSPSHPSVLFGYAHYLLFVEGRTKEALDLFERILLLAPFELYLRVLRVDLFYITRQYERTLEETERVRELYPDFVYPHIGHSYFALGRFEAGRREGGMHDASPLGMWGGSITAMRESPRQFGATFSASLFAHLGDTEAAFAWLERSYQERDPFTFSTLTVHPGVDPLRADRRFDDLLRRIGLPETREDPAMLAEVGYALARAGRSAEALARLERARELSPTDPRLSRWLHYTALAHFAAERVEQATDWAERALQQALGEPLTASSPFLPHHHLLLAACYAHLDRLDDARKTLAEALRLWPGIRIDRDLAPIFLDGDPTLRDRYYNSLLQTGLPDTRPSVNHLHANDFTVLLGRRTREDNARARVIAREMAAVPAVHRGVWVLNGVLADLQLLAEGWADSPSATVTQMNRHARSCVEESPSSGWCMAAAGVAGMVGGEQEQMLASFERAVDLFQQSAWAYGSLGNALALAGRAEEAIAALEEAMRLAPESPDRAGWFVSMANAHFAAGRYEEAVVWAEQRVRLPRNHPVSSIADAHQLLGTSYAHLGRLEEAHAAVEEALSLRPALTDLAANSPILSAWDSDLRHRYLDGLRMAGLEE